MNRWIAVLVALLASFSVSASAQTVVDGPLPEPAPQDPSVVAIAAPATPTRAELRAMLAEQRDRHLEELQRYVTAGVFPVNDVQDGYLNVFQDPSGNLCAVANLMSFDGDGEMVQTTAASTNYIRLVDVHEGALYDWILSSGFTQEEIGRIQEPYFFQAQMENLQRRQQNLDRERNRLQRTLNRTIARLTRQRERSLDIAVDRLMRAQTHAMS